MHPTYIASFFSPHLYQTLI